MQAKVLRVYSCHGLMTQLPTPTRVQETTQGLIALPRRWNNTGVDKRWRQIKRYRLTLGLRTAQWQRRKRQGWPHQG
jgi:hypothetical protein